MLVTPVCHRNELVNTGLSIFVGGLNIVPLTNMVVLATGIYFGMYKRRITFRDAFG